MGAVTWDELVMGPTRRSAHYVEPVTLYYAQRVEDYGGKDVWWEVINNKTGAIIASVTDHDAAHDLVRLFTETQVILSEHMKKE